MQKVECTFFVPFFCEVSEEMVMIQTSSVMFCGWFPEVGCCNLWLDFFFFCLSCHALCNVYVCYALLLFVIDCLSSIVLYYIHVLTFVSVLCDVLVNIIFINDWCSTLVHRDQYFFYFLKRLLLYFHISCIKDLKSMTSLLIPHTVLIITILIFMSSILQSCSEHNNQKLLKNGSKC